MSGDFGYPEMPAGDFARLLEDCDDLIGEGIIRFRGCARISRERLPIY